MTRAEREAATARRVAKAEKWRNAAEQRAGFSPADLEAEEAELARIAAEMVESGAVTICPPGPHFQQTWHKTASL